MTTSALSDDRLLPAARTPHQEVGYWAMVLFVLTEAALFAYLLSSYFFLGVSNRFWPPAGVERPKLEKPLLMTALLVSSSLVLLWAEKARELGGIRRYRIGSMTTMLLGLAFLGVQAMEYHEKVQHMPPKAHAYASIFYLITGVHGSHVALGLLMIGWTLAADLRGRLPAMSPLAVKNSSLYWHFVDGVWLVILVCLYLSPRWY